MCPPLLLFLLYSKSGYNQKEKIHARPLCYAKMLAATLLPSTVTNSYRGSPVSKAVFAAMTVLTIGRSLAHIFLKDGGSRSIATIPLDRYQPEASDTIISMFALWGLSQLLMGFVYLLVLWRYQSLIPLMWLFVLVEWSGRLMVGICKPTIETIETPPGAVGNVVIPILSIIMLPLSLRKEAKNF